jgi:hypothetical protein
MGPFSSFYATLGVDSKDLLQGLKTAQRSVDVFAAKTGTKLRTIALPPTVGKGFAGLNKSLQLSTTAMDRFTNQASRMGNVFTGGLGLGILAGGLYSLTALFTRGVEKAQEFETGILSIAAAQQSAYEWTNKAGKAISGETSFLASLNTSFKINNALIDRAAKNILTYQEQLAAFRTGVPYLSRMTADWKVQIGLTERLAVAAKVLGQSGNQVAQQVRAILGGSNVQKSVLGSALGLTNSDVKAWKQAGTLIDELEKRLTGFQAGSSFFENSIEGIRAQFENTIDLFLADLGKGFIRNAKGSMKEFQAFLEGGGGKQLGKTLSQLFDNILKGLRTLAESPAIPILMRFMEFLAANADKIIVIGVWTKLLGVLTAVSRVALTAGANFFKMGQAGEKAATAATAAANAAAVAGAAPRGPNAAGRLNSAAAAAAPMQGTLGLYPEKDPRTGRFVKRPSVPVPPAPTGQMALFDPNDSSVYFQSIKKGNKSIAQNLAAGWKKQMAGVQAKLAATMTQENFSNFLGKAGIAALAYGLIEAFGMGAKSLLGNQAKEYTHQIDGAMSTLQGAAVGFALGGPVGALAGAIAGLGKGIFDWGQSVLNDLEKARVAAEDATQEMMDKNPMLRVIRDSKDKSRQLMDKIAEVNSSDLLTDRAKSGIAGRLQGELARERQREADMRSSGTAQAKVRKAVDDFQKGAQEAVKGWEGALKVLGLMPESLKKTLSTKFAEMMKRINEVKLLSDEDLASRGAPGEDSVGTRRRLMREVAMSGVEELNAASREAARDVTDMGISVRSAQFSLAASIEAYDRFFVNLPAEQANILNGLLNANKTYLDALSSTSTVLSQLRTALETRAKAEAEAAALAQQYGLTKPDVMNAFYGDVESSEDVMKKFVAEAKKNLADVTAEYRAGQASLTELNKAQDRLRTTESAGFAQYLKDSQKTSEALAGNNIQQAGSALATAQFDYAANLRNLQTQAVQMQDAITSSVTGLQRISEEFVKSQAQFEQMRLAAANGAAAINNMIRSVLPNDMSVAWNFNIQVDNVMKEIIDPAKLEAHVQKEIRRYVDNACRGSNR